jgi:hypothetical protein
MFLLQFLALQAQLHDAVIRQQRAETELLHSQQRHAHELQASKQSFEAAFHVRSMFMVESTYVLSPQVSI